MNVYHNYGRWIVDCPSVNCLASVRAEMGLTMMLCDCHDDTICQHGPVCATPIPLEWPNNPGAIVEVLAGRQIPNRNWVPGESLKDLELENLERGVG